MRISDWSSDVCSSDLFTGFLAVRRSIVTIGVGVAVLFALLAAGGAGTLTRLLEIGDHAETRFELYRRTIDATADSPWLGTGLGAFGDTFRLYRTQQIEHPFGEAHDTYLENVMDLGIPAGAALRSEERREGKEWVCPLRSRW